MKAMIFAAGLGTRLKPLTNDRPKALVEVNGVPLLEITIKRLVQCGFNEIIVNVHHFPEKMKDFLKNGDRFGADITISDETDELLDTGGGLKKTEWFFNDNKPFLVHNVDIISDINLTDLYQFHINSGSLSTLAVRNRKTSRYFMFDDKNYLCGWKNMNTHEIRITRRPNSKLKSLAFSGIHVISPEIFSFINSRGKFSITETYIDLAFRHKIAGYIHDDSLWMDLGKPESVQAAELYFKTL